MVISFNPSVRTLFLVIIVGIAVGAIGNAISAFENQTILNNQQETLDDLIYHTEGAEDHFNVTNETLNIIKTALQNQTADTEKFMEHINQTATAAPIVSENQKVLEEILVILQALEAQQAAGQ
jgi:hypothetical protein